MKIIRHYCFFLCFLFLAVGCTIHVQPEHVVGSGTTAVGRCQGILMLTETTKAFTVSATKVFHGATYVVHLGQQLESQLPSFFAGMRTAQDSGADQGLALTLEFGPSTSARLGVTIFSGNEVTVALKYALSDRSGGSILTEGTVEGKGSVPTGGEALIAPLPAAYIMTQDAFAGASQQAMTTALSALRAQLVKHGVCQAS